MIPYPTDYKTKKSIAIDAFSFTPSAEAVRISAIAMKEYLGILAVKLGRSKIRRYNNYVFNTCFRFAKAAACCIM